jgi:predicted PurR-regulated permease PerM
VSAKKIVVSTYLQYILIALGALLLFVFVQQLSGVLLTFLFAGILAYALNPVVRRLEGWWVPGAVAVAALLVLIVPGVGLVQPLVQIPGVLSNGAAELLDQARGLPYIGEQIDAIDQAAVTRLVQSNTPFATALYGAIFAVPIVVIVAATLRYLRGPLPFERWRKPSIVMAVPERAKSGEGFAVPAESPTTSEETSVQGFGERKR